MRTRSLLTGSAVVVLLAAAVVLWWQRRIEAGIDPTHAAYAAFDDYVYYYPTSRYAFGELRAGRFPFWNPYQHAGSPFFATAQHGLLYPPNVVRLLVTEPTAEKVAALLHLALAGLGAALLGRAWRQGWPGALTTGVAFAFAVPITALIYLPHHLYAVAWIPWQVFLLHRVLTSPTPWSWAALLGLCSGLQYLGGYPMYCVMSAYVLAGYFFWWRWGSWRTAAGRRRLLETSLAVVAAALLAGSLSAPQLLPGLELAGQSPRGWTALSLQQAALNSVRPVPSILRAVLPMHDAERVLPSVYAGVPLLLLAVLGIGTGRDTGARFFLGLTVMSWVLACGTYTPLFHLYYLLPGGGAFRVPYRFFPITSLGIAVLGGAGVDALWRERLSRSTIHALSWGGLALGVAALLIWWLVPLPDRIEPAVSRPPSFPLFMVASERPAMLVRWLGWQLVAAAAWLFVYGASGRAFRRALVVMLPAIVYATLFVATRNTEPIPVTHPDLHVMPERAAAFLRQIQGFDRTYVAPTSWPVGPPGRHLPAKAGVLHGLYAVNDRENVYAKRFAEFVALMLPTGVDQERAALMEQLQLPPYIPQGEVVVRADSPNLRLLDLLGARFIVEGTGATFRAENAPERFVPIFDEDGVRIFRNLEALPRAFLVHRAEVVAEPARVLQRLVNPEFDPHTTALLERAPPLGLPDQRDSGGTAEIVRYTPDEVVVDMDAPSAGILVLTDEYYPGWTSEVDGTPTEIQVTDYVFRGVPVGPRKHRVVFRYVPASFQHGVWIAALGSLLALCALGALRRRDTIVRGQRVRA